MHNSGSYQFRALDAVNCLGLWMTLITLGHELSALDTMDISELWLIGMTMGRKLRALDAMNNVDL